MNVFAGVLDAVISILKLHVERPLCASVIKKVRFYIKLRAFGVNPETPFIRAATWTNDQRILPQLYPNVSTGDKGFRQLPRGGGRPGRLKHTFMASHPGWL
jgi:hypothetical protein